MKKPYLLAPCGSPEAVRAAICAGADECYFGGSGKNARMNAKGFSEDEFYRALELIKIHGKRSNITLNTLLFDRELEETVEFAKKAYSHGADAFIIQDLGLAAILKREIPGVELHASTQCACHNLAGAVELWEKGFSRIVLARELSFPNIKEISKAGEGKFETEVFVHGALCVCHSGMCLMSSVIGDRSGNRGLCAQPCRMPGSIGAANNKSNGTYPLSLRDLSLSKHITELLPLGIASLKIEGRMKSPEYVYRTVKIFRELLDSGENCDEKRYSELLDIFSRGGFTDGYFTGKYLLDNRKMYGYRSETDKERTAKASFEVPELPKVPVKLKVIVKRDQYPTASFYCRDKVGKYTLPVLPSEAQNAPLTEELLLKNMKKLGSTSFQLSESEVTLDDGLFLTAKDINELRRGAVEKLIQEITEVSLPKSKEVELPKAEKTRTAEPKLRFFTDTFDFEKDSEKYPEELESICVPLELFCYGKVLCDIKLPFGVRLPRVIFNGEEEGVKKALSGAKESGAKYVYISNIGHLKMALETELPVYGGMGLNVTNSYAALEYAKLGISSLTLSPELNSAQIRDIERIAGVKYAMVCEGRLPLMVLESCILRCGGMCKGEAENGKMCGEYTDRIGKKFPVYPEKRFTENKNAPCRNIILNADILSLYSKKNEIAKANVDILEIFCNI